MVKIILLISFCFAFTSKSVAADNNKKNKKVTLEVNNNYLGKNYSEVKKLFSETPRDIKCEEDDAKNCMDKFKAKCSCHRGENLDPVLGIPTSEVTFIVHKGKIVESRQLYLMKDSEIYDAQSAYMVNKFDTVTKAEAPKDLYREIDGGMNNRAVTRSLYYYMAKWTKKSGYDMYAALRCQDRIDDGKLVLNTKVRDCWIKFFVATQIRTIEPFEDYQKVEFEY